VLRLEQVLRPLLVPPLSTNWLDSLMNGLLWVAGKALHRSLSGFEVWLHPVDQCCSGFILAAMRSLQRGCLFQRGPGRTAVVQVNERA